MPPSGSPKFTLNLDLRTLETLKWSAVWNAVGAGILYGFTYISYFFLGGLVGEFVRAVPGLIGGFQFGHLINTMFWGAVYGAVVGFLLSKFYAEIQKLNSQYLQGKLNTFFKLLFYPSLALSLLVFVMGSAASFGFMSFLVVVIGMIVRAYVYAEMMQRKVGVWFKA